MGGELMHTVVAIVTAIIGLAILSVLVSKNAKTGALIQNVSSGLGQDIAAATSPLNSGGMSPTFSFSSN